MSRASSRVSSPELLHASQALAEFFAGVILVEEADGTLQQIGQATEAETPRSMESSLLEVGEFELNEAEAGTEIESLRDTQPLDQPPSESQVLISLAQLRQWYALARSQGQHDRLSRIQALGILFKQSFGDTEPEVQKPFVGWSAEEIQWWLSDFGSSAQTREVPSAMDARFGMQLLK